MSKTKIVLGAAPKSFTAVVEVPLLDGSTGTIACRYRYRTRSQFGELLDRMRQSALAAAAAPAEPAPAPAPAAPKRRGAKAIPAAPVAETASEAPQAFFSMQDSMRRGVEKNVDYLLEVLDGWDLDIPLSRESLLQLADELPGAVGAIVDKYYLACTEGRLGN